MNKMRDTFERLDATKERLDFKGLGAASAALDAADRIGSGLDRIDAFGSGAGIGSLAASDVLGARFGALADTGMAEAKTAALGRDWSALVGPSDKGLLSAAAGLAEPPSWMEPPLWVKDSYGLVGAEAKFSKPGVLDGVGGAEKWRGFGVSTSLGGIRDDLYDLGAARRGFDTVGDISHGLLDLGKPGTLLGDLGLGETGAASLYGAGGLTGAKASGVLGGVFEPFEGVAEMARKTFDWMDALRPHLDRWGQIAEEALRAARRIAATPARPGDHLLALEAHEALEALRRGRHKVAARFLEDRLNLRASIERLEALWLYLTKSFERPVSSPPLWVTLEGGKARAYLATAIFKIAERIKLRRRMEDDIWGSARDQNGRKELVRPRGGWLVYAEEQPTGDLASDGLDPARAVSLGMDARNRILDELAATGTPADKEIVGLIQSGDYDRADIRNIVGSPRLQAFERKIQRRLKSSEN